MEYSVGETSTLCRPEVGGNVFFRTVRRSTWKQNLEIFISSLTRKPLKERRAAELDLNPDSDSDIFIYTGLQKK